jgi:hypothetical protein
MDRMLLHNTTQCSGCPADGIQGFKNFLIGDIDIRFNKQIVNRKDKFSATIEPPPKRISTPPEED